MNFGRCPRCRHGANNGYIRTRKLCAGDSRIVETSCDERCCQIWVEIESRRWCEICWRFVYFAVVVIEWGDRLYRFHVICRY